LPAIKVLLPIGISFYTFAGISYAVDVYRGTIKPARSVIHYLAWVTLFPYILAGPIIRYGHVGAQLERAQQRFRWALIGTGLFFLVMGFAKKMLVADMMAPYVNELFSHHAHLGLLSGWAAALGYTLQLYFDFSGYSDMAVGVAIMIGLRFPQNFDSPYKAVNPSDFWRRWHMTLSGWLRDYLFIPLGGSRGTTLLTVRNLLITFLLGGLWHGPAWTFVFWGLLWGTYQSVHVIAKKYGLTPKWVWLNRILTFVAATVAWVFFRASSLRAAADVLKAMAGLNGVSGEGILRVAPLLAAFIVGGLLWVNLLPNTWQIQPRPKLRYALVLGILLAASLLALSKPSPFLYVQF
jgi:D-alanyl-lipoteichoic acid acyltransferase DltB (MBOAT superfamily)